MVKTPTFLVIYLKKSQLWQVICRLTVGICMCMHTEKCQRLVKMRHFRLSVLQPRAFLISRTRSQLDANWSSLAGFQEDPWFCITDNLLHTSWEQKGPSAFSFFFLLVSCLHCVEATIFTCSLSTSRFAFFSHTQLIFRLLRKYFDCDYKPLNSLVEDVYMRMHYLIRYNNYQALHNFSFNQQLTSRVP